ncbi:MAG: VCBS repeat-containing protein [Acidobacteriota bacterium]|nr:VCBS repeat-containing protein [Acidobacteriota bacterium]
MKKIFQIIIALTCFLCLGGLAAAQSAVGFAPAKNYPAGASVFNVVAEDFNGDGKPDLATTNNFDNNSVSILLNNGDGTFQTPVSYNIGAATGSIVAGDFNGDGKRDLAVNAGSFSVDVLLGNGDGTFQPNLYSNVNLNPGSLVVADFNGDGKQDLAMSVQNNVAVLLGNGSGTFQPAVYFFLGSSTPSSLVAGDFDGDSKPDVAYTDNISRGISVLHGNGDGTFQTGVGINLGNPVGRLTAADFNADGKPDLAISSGGQALGFIVVNVFLGNGDGTFSLTPDNNIFNLSPSGAGFTAPGVTNLAAADFNGDGKLDIIAPDAPLRLIHAFLGNGDGTFQSPAIVSVASPFAFFAATGDFDGNTSPDLVTANGNDNSVSVLLNTAGNPPLLASLSFNPAIVEGGNTSQGTIALGSPAPIGGDTVALSNSNPAITSIPASVFIPEGATSATFSVLTNSVILSSAGTINASLNGVTQTATITVVPSVVLASLTLNPTSVFGGITAQGTVSLQGDAPSSGVTITLSSSNAAIAAVPPSVTIPAGSSSANFAINTQVVASDSGVTISATFGSTTKLASLAVLSPRDKVVITKAEYNSSPRVRQLLVEATGSNSTATLTVYLTSTGQAIGTLTNSGGGKYKGQFFIQSGSPQNITVRSNLGGSATRVVTIK